MRNDARPIGEANPHGGPPDSAPPDSSNDAREPVTHDRPSHVVNEAADENERARRHRIAIPAGRTIAQVLEDVDREYGGPRAFLDGVSTEHLDRLVLRLRGD